MLNIYTLRYIYFMFSAAYGEEGKKIIIKEETWGKKRSQYHFQLCKLCSFYIKNKDRSVHVLPPYQSHGYSVLCYGERSAFELSREQ